MNVREAQLDLQRAYVGGGPGVIVSALVWLTAGVVAQAEGVRTAFAVLFIGGMLIFPLTTIAVRLFFRRERQASQNPFGATVLECTIAMIGGLIAAWLFLPFQPDYVFPLAAIAVGTHYAVFKTAYGDALFWVLGGLVTAVGFFAIFGGVPIPGGPIFAVGSIELLFGLLLTVRGIRGPQPVR